MRNPVPVQNSKLLQLPSWNCCQSKYFLNVDGSICMRIDPCYLSAFEFIQSEEFEPES